MEVNYVTRDIVSGHLDPWGSFDVMVAVTFPHLANGHIISRWPWRAMAHRLLTGRSALKHLGLAKDCRCAEGVSWILSNEGCWRSLETNAYICLMPVWRRVYACLALCSSLKCQKIRNASQHEAFQTHMWQEIWHELYKCQMSRIKQYGYSISSAILVPCAWACSIRKTAFQLWVIALLALSVHVWKYSWVTN